MVPPYQCEEVLVHLDKVCLTLGGKQILRDVSVDIRNITRPGMNQGQIVGFLGPSGVGKTKLFEIMAGLLEPTSGTVQVGAPLEPIRVGRVGVVQQHYPLFQHRTVLGNMTVAAEMNKTLPPSERKARVRELLERFGLYPHRDHYPAQLSGGQRQRVAIAQQIICSETFLLLDEPFSGLDVNMVKEVSDLLLEIATQDELTTIIVVSHDIPATAAISDTLWVMGRDRTPEGGLVPGAYIKHVYDLIERDLCWRKDLADDPAFADLVKEVRGLFPDL
jgi:polar amino acid transport system ATP-binding protein/sulfate transport system ATP-binding protein